MLRMDYLLEHAQTLKNDYWQHLPFPCLVIDNSCEEEELTKCLNIIKSTNTSQINKSRDFVFAKNKFEKSSFHEIHPLLSQLRDELLSEKFAKFLSIICDEDVFVDPSFHGGGLHQGGKDSFLNMHADFDYHPNEPNWFRNVNILLYLNKNWSPEHRGQLRLVNANDKMLPESQIEPIFNRMVIMQTRANTLHGYDKISFPEGEHRLSIATYGYTYHNNPEKGRTTVWYPENKGFIFNALGRNMHRLVRIKKAIFGSGTTKNM